MGIFDYCLAGKTRCRKPVGMPEEPLHHPHDKLFKSGTNPEIDAGALIMNFNCLPVAARGTATLKVAHSNTLASWTATTSVVPDATDATNTPSPPVARYRRQCAVATDP